MEKIYMIPVNDAYNTASAPGALYADFAIKQRPTILSIISVPL